MHLPLKAFIDGVVHKTSLERTVYVTKEVYTGTTLLYSQTIRTTQVILLDIP